MIDELVKETAASMLEDKSLLCDVKEYSCCVIVDKMVENHGYAPHTVYQHLDVKGVEFLQLILDKPETLCFELSPDTLAMVKEDIEEQDPTAFVHYISRNSTDDLSDVRFKNVRTAWLTFLAEGN
ncbi:hypothetical protein VPFG_00234 [Vibrio phage nt-1]|uniref:Uncharacterized protein n=1 Tax=Vibrio phage nt-1 TaxID=115992 RepID=R9TGK4_9CAUD|nr:hypothetical protein VPFG_00234 [Vibrio phage nt-1]AGN30233.1 hypothetical protein VPFG_00234 [Vibrio phage nt-1]